MNDGSRSHDFQVNQLDGLTLSYMGTHGDLQRYRTPCLPVSYMHDARLVDHQCQVVGDLCSANFAARKTTWEIALKYSNSTTTTIPCSSRI